MFTAIINNVYMHDHGKIILFNSSDEAQFFVQKFIEYSQARAMQEGKIILIPSIMSADIQIEEWTDRMSCPCGTINFDNIKR